MYVIDITGLNNAEIAHLPHPGQNLWGKRGPAIALARRPEIISFGFLIWSEQLLANYSAHDLIADEALATRFLGYRFFAPLAAEYRTASVPVEGVYLNLFVREDQVERARGAGILVNGP
jgi:hypothetical protein